MKRLFLCVAAVASAVVATPSMARVTYVDEDQRGPLAQYCSHYIDARVEINTRGHLVRGRSAPYWSHAGLGDNVEWDRDQDPAVYIQTRRTVEAGHYTLVPGPC